ncbi:MAG: phospholipid carrier-dependent glycosyltransferase, partial [Candidatus Rokuibacteriota bacterium]
WALHGGPSALARRLARDRAVLAALVAIMLLATAARAPGLFWGYRLFGTLTVPHLNPDEAKYSERIASDILNHRVDLDNPHPPGLGAQVAFAWYVLDRLDLGEVARSDEFWFFAGRIVSLLAGVATVGLLYALALEFFRDRATALLAAYFLALSSLHVTVSHTAKQDAAATLWLYASLYASLVFYRRPRLRVLAAAALSAGAAVAMKYVTVTVIPLLFAVARARRRVYAAAGVAVLAAGAFFLFGGFSLTIETLPAVRRLSRFLLAPPRYSRLHHVALYLGYLVIGMSLPIVVLAAYAGWRAVPRDRAAVLAALRDDRLPLIVALAIAFVQIVMIRFPSPHYLATLLPLVALLAARGFERIRRRWPAPVGRLMFGAVSVYLLAHVGSVEYHFVRDTREIAGEWLRRHVPTDEVLSVSRYAIVPPEYRTTPYLDRRYLVLHESGFRRYLIRHTLHSRFTGRFPAAHEIYRPELKYGHYPRIPQLFRGELPYTLVKRVPLRLLTPELALGWYLGFAPLGLGETLIFRARADAVVGGGAASGTGPAEAMPPEE